VPDAAEGAISPGIAQVQEPLRHRRLWRDRGREVPAPKGQGPRCGSRTLRQKDRGVRIDHGRTAPLNFLRELHGQANPLFDTHVASGAKIVDFGGWDMPVAYGSQIEEHHAVRRDAGMFDVSHMCPVDVEGADARAFFRRSSPTTLTS